MGAEFFVSRAVGKERIFDTCFFSDYASVVSHRCAFLRGLVVDLYGGVNSSRGTRVNQSLHQYLAFGINPLHRYGNKLWSSLGRSF